MLKHTHKLTAAQMREWIKGYQAGTAFIEDLPGGPTKVTMYLTSQDQQEGEAKRAERAAAYARMGRKDPTIYLTLNIK